MAAYELLLLNTSIPQIQAAQTGDTYVCPRDIAFSAALTLSAGTANGVPYLNGSKVLTSGSALTFDGSILTLGGTQRINGTSSSGLLLTSSSGASNGFKLYNDSATDAAYVMNFYNGPLIFGQNNTEQMRLTSTGLGIGTSSPADKLDVLGGKIRHTLAGGGVQLVLGNSLNAVSLGSVQASGDASLAFYTNTSTERMRLDSSGNLGLGVTPSAWGLSGAKTLQINNAAFWGYLNNAYVSANNYNDGTGNKYIATGFATRYSQATGQHIWETAASGTAGNTISFTQAMTLDASGNLGIGDTSPSTTLSRMSARGPYADLASGYGTIFAASTDSQAADKGGTILFGGAFTGTTVTALAGIKGAKENSTDGNFAGYLSFWSRANGAAPTERARITSGGVLLVNTISNPITDTCKFVVYGGTAEYNAAFYNSSATNPFGFVIRYSAAAPNGTGNQFIDCVDTGATRAQIRSNGGLANYQANDVNLSDQRTKKDIVAAPSYWDKIKGIEIVHFKYKDQTHDDNNVGVIAQQVEQVAPEFVDQDGWGETPEDGVPLKSIYTSDMYHAAIKALQEAMARIETLEAEVAALKGA